ncbi:MAG: hypothetical protein OXF22_06655 [Anaerolineaceae bacterium]|nr:hypothetical protein [Anaerolineaceae bacterium]
MLGKAIIMGRMVRILFTLGLFFGAGGTILAEEETAAECPRTITITDAAGLFVSIRHFEGVDPANIPEIGRIAQDEFLPLLKEARGFRLYATASIRVEDQETVIATAVNVFTSEEEMQNANELALEFVSANAAELLPLAPTIYSGNVNILVAYANPCPTQETSATTDDEERSPAYLGYRVYSDVEEADDIDAINALVRDHFVPVISAAEGFILYLNFTLLPPLEGVVALNIFASEAELKEANDQAAEFVAEDLAELLPSPPQFYGGDVTVLDFSGLFADAALDDQEAEQSETAGEGDEK